MTEEKYLWLERGKKKTKKIRNLKKSKYKRKQNTYNGREKKGKNNQLKKKRNYVKCVSAKHLVEEKGIE